MDQGEWEYGDESFERFASRLAKRCDDSSQVWAIRDSIFYALTYSQASAQPVRRHRCGLVSWIPWLVTNYFRSPGTSPRIVPAQIPEGATHFLFHGWHASHYGTLLPLLRERSLRGPCVAWVHSLREEQLVELESIDEVQVVRVDHWRADRRVVAAAGQAARSLGSAAVEMAEEVFGQKLSAKRQSALWEIAYSLSVWESFWQDAFTRVRGGEFIVTSEANPLAKGYISSALQRGGRVSHYCHGMAHAAHAVTRSQKLVTFAEADAEWFRKRVPESCEVIAGGNPRMAEIKKRVGPPRKRRENEAFRVLFFAQGVESPYTEQRLIEDLAVMRLPEDLMERVQLRIRIHPREEPGVARTQAERAGLRVESFSQGRLEDDIEWADACATAWSTALLEGMACGRPGFWVSARPERLARTGEFIQRGVGKAISSRDEWVAAIGSRISPADNPKANRTETKADQ